MFTDLKFLFLKDIKVQVSLFLFFLLSVWWLFLDPLNPTTSEALVNKRYLWGASYQILALWGGICGLFISRSWGGVKSVVGRSILAFSLGLLLQVFGQTAYSYYNLFAQIQAPYPSIGDVGFFGSIPLYIYGAFLLTKVSGVKISLGSFFNQASAIIIPLLMLATSYLLFLKQYEFDWSSKITILLDFGYPLGQAVYVSIAILALILSRKTLGGIMRSSILLLLFALIIQYLSDFNFLYQAHKNTWYVGSYGDYLYAVSYLLMSLGIMYIGHMVTKLKTT